MQMVQIRALYKPMYSETLFEYPGSTPSCIAYNELLKGPTFCFHHGKTHPPQGWNTPASSGYRVLKPQPCTSLTSILLHWYLVIMCFKLPFFRPIWGFGYKFHFLRKTIKCGGYQVSFEFEVRCVCVYITREELIWNNIEGPITNNHSAKEALENSYFPELSRQFSSTFCIYLSEPCSLVK